jgi:molybdopterin-guanine dinucleotide biosynthesis protein A
MTSPPPDNAVTLGILAGGRATRLGGADKAWLERDGVAQVLRLSRRFTAEVAAILVSANRDPARYAPHGLRVVADAPAGLGPIGGLAALATAARTPWLMTLPVDLLGVNECLLRTLQASGPRGAFAEDQQGIQPLVALWRVDLLRDALPAALADGDYAVQGLQRHLRMAPVRFDGVRFGNLNTPADIVAAGMTLSA